MVIEALTALLVIITAFYAWVTYKILRANEAVVHAMNEQAVSMSRPYVVVAPHLELDNPIFYLKITNMGKTAARNLCLSLDKSFYKFGETTESQNLATATAFNQPIASFPPGSEITFSLAQGFKVFEGKVENPNMPHTFTVVAEYEYDGRTTREQHAIDLRPYHGADVPQDAYIRRLRSMNESLENIAKLLKVAP